MTANGYFQLAFYLVVLIGVRLSGKREVGQMTPLDLTLLLLISNAVQNAMTGPDTSLVGVTGRIAAAAPGDAASVAALAQQLQIVPLSRFAKTAAPKAAPAITFPAWDDAKADSAAAAEDCVATNCAPISSLRRAAK